MRTKPYSHKEINQILEIRADEEDVTISDEVRTLFAAAFVCSGGCCCRIPIIPCAAC